MNDITYGFTRIISVGTIRELSNSSVEPGKLSRSVDEFKLTTQPKFDDIYDSKVSLHCFIVVMYPLFSVQVWRMKYFNFASISHLSVKLTELLNTKHYKIRNYVCSIPQTRAIRRSLTDGVCSWQC